MQYILLSVTVAAKTCGTGSYFIRLFLVEEKKKSHSLLKLSAVYFLLQCYL